MEHPHILFYAHLLVFCDPSSISPSHQVEHLQQVVYMHHAIKTNTNLNVKRVSLDLVTVTALLETCINGE